MLPVINEEGTNEQIKEILHYHIANSQKSSFAKNITEKEWFRNVCKVWELVKKSNAIYEYKATLQKMQIYK